MPQKFANNGLQIRKSVLTSRHRSTIKGEQNAENRTGSIAGVAIGSM